MGRMTTEFSTTRGTAPATKTITIRPSSLQPAKSAKNQQQIIVIPHSMLVNGCISAKDLKNIIDDSKPSIKTMENRINLKRPSSSGDSTYGTDSEEGSSIHYDEGGDNKPVRKRANLDHLSPEEKLMRRKLKNRVAAQNARDKKRVKMEDMETDVDRLRAHAKALELRNAELVSRNERLVAENDLLRSEAITKTEAEEPSSPLVVGQPPESSAGTGLSSLGRWTTGLNGLSGDSLEVVVECNQSNSTPEKTANKEESPMADVVGKILKTEDFDFTDEQDANACEQILDKFLEFTSEIEPSSSSNTSNNDNTILDTAWEETFGDLFPDLGECTF